jgi:hypothetical protein
MYSTKESMIFAIFPPTMMMRAIAPLAIP